MVTVTKHSRKIYLTKLFKTSIYENTQKRALLIFRFPNLNLQYTVAIFRTVSLFKKNRKSLLFTTSLCWESYYLKSHRFCNIVEVFLEILIVKLKVQVLKNTANLYDLILFML